MTSMKSLLLASSALFAVATVTPVQAAPTTQALVVAQAQGGNPALEKKKDKKEEHKNKKKKGAPQHKAGPPLHKAGPPQHKPGGQPPSHPKPPAAAQQKPSAAPAAKRPEPPHPKQAAPLHKPEPPHPAQAGPKRKPAPPAAAEKKAPPPKQAAPAKQPQPLQQPAAEQKRQSAPKQPASNQATPKQAPKQAAPKEAPKQAPMQAAPAASESKPAPAKSATPAQQQPVRPRDAREFIRKDNSQPRRTIKDVRQERSTTRQDGRVFIHEGDRTIVRERNHTFIRHNEDQRFAIGARDVRTHRRDGQTITIIMRPDGVRIINTTDRNGHLIRRVRRDRNGREFVIINNRRHHRNGIFIDVRPPRIRMPRHRYIVDADRADEREIYDVLVAPPVEEIDRDYSLAQVRYNAPLREYMRRLDLDIHFDTGSWQLTPAQMDRLSLVARALNRAIDRNPHEVFLIEGHTDAVGSEEDNLSLSDRRAESVAVALTEAFHVPAENLVTQGYGEQELKVQTQEANRTNRRVAVRRITPLIDHTAQR